MEVGVKIYEKSDTQPEDGRNVGYEDAIECIRQVISAHLRKGKPVADMIVLVGGTAMAANNIRDLSEDVDFFASVVDADIIHELEKAFVEKYGPKFRIDATIQENIWGKINIRDIADSPYRQQIYVDGISVDVRMLPPEDLFLLKAEARREKDLRDLPVLAEHCDFENLVVRLGKFIKWHPHPNELSGYIDRMARTLSDYFNVPMPVLIEKIEMPNYIKEMLREAYPDDTLDADLGIQPEGDKPPKP